jgi:hypothetical protein
MATSMLPFTSKGELGRRIEATIEKVRVSLSLAALKLEFEFDAHSLCRCGGRVPCCFRRPG